MKTLRITAEILSNNNGDKALSSDIAEIQLSIPTTAAEVGLPRKEQLDIITKVQQIVLTEQANFMTSTHKGCPKCHSNIVKNGTKISSFDHVYSTHKVLFQKWKCSASHCDWQESASFLQEFETKLSPELVKIQAELGAQLTYRKAESAMTLMTEKRKINNKSRIHRTTNTVGSNIEKSVNRLTSLASNDVEYSSPAKELYVHVDGFFIHDDENRGHNFEAMVAKVYKPENVIHKGKEKRPIIIEKQCAGSAKKDNQATMKHRIVDACKLEGLTDHTVITALSDGASNCWNILNSLTPLCFTIIFILDWFHITKYITNVKSILPDEHSLELDSVKTNLWHGKAEEAQDILLELKNKLQEEKHLDKIDNFYKYIKDNKDRIVDYNDRDEKGLIFTSSVAESTVNHFGSQRFKKLQQMQWKRDNAHGVLQIRSSIISGNWDIIWRNEANNLYRQSAA